VSKVSRSLFLVSGITAAIAIAADAPQIPTDPPVSIPNLLSRPNVNVNLPNTCACRERCESYVQYIV
jgi:hypothetical protein